MMMPIKRGSLLTYLLGMIVGVVGLFFLFLWLNLNLTQRYMEDMERARILSALKSNLENLSDAIYFGFDKPVREIAEQILRENPGIREIVIEPVHGKRLRIVRKIHGRAEIEWRKEEIPIERESQAVGMLRVEYQTVDAHQYFQRYRQVAVVISVFLIVVLMLGLRFVYRRFAALTQLAETLRRLDPADRRSLQNGEDYFEIRLITEAVNRMLQNIAEYAEDLKKVNRKLLQNEKRLVNAQRIARMSSWTFWPETRRLEVTGEFYRLLEINKKKSGRVDLSFVLRSLHHEDRPLFMATLFDAIRQGKRFDITHRIITAKGNIRHLRTEGKVRKSMHHPTEVVGISLDVTEEMEAKRQAEHMAFYDPLTGLLNRRAFMDRVEYLLKVARRDDETLALIFIDLDNFKYINDSYGHTVGDGLLVRIAELLEAAVRDTDIVARLGGDEFVVVVPSIHSKDAVTEPGRKILDAITRQFEIDGHRFSVTASLGIAFYPQDADGADTLLRYADAAMYEAKRMGKNRMQLFNESIRRRISQHADILEQIRNALRRDDEIRLYFQPQIDLRTGRVRGAEVLSRWHHPKKGVLLPNHYIPVIESSSLMSEYDNYILEKAVAYLADWQQKGYKWVLGVNLSARQFNDPRLIARLEALSNRYRIDPAGVEIEITESLPMEDMQTAISMLQKIKTLGFKIAIDDFGTGYSSLSYLQKLPFDVIKIDREFIKNTHQNEEDIVIVRLMIQIAKALGKSVVAEGPDKAEHIRILEALACDFAQGFYYSKAIEAEAFAAFAAKREGVTILPDTRDRRHAG